MRFCGRSDHVSLIAYIVCQNSCESLIIRDCGQIYQVSILIFIIFLRLFAMLRVEKNPWIWVQSYAWCLCVLYTPIFFHLYTLLTLEFMYMMFIVWFLVSFLLFMWCLSWRMHDGVYHIFMWFTSLTQPHLLIEPLLFTYV